jgi:hypothetical protein
MSLPKQIARRLGNNKGVAFVVAVAMMFALLGMGLAYVYVLRSELQTGQNQRAGLQAFYFAEAGAEHAMAELIEGTDTHADGLGNLPLMDLDGDGDSDYSVTYSLGTGEIISVGQELGATRRVNYHVTTGTWTGAMQVGGNININAPAGGTINGDVDAVGTIHPNIALYTVNGTKTANNASLTIPTPNFAEYANPVNFPTENHYTYSDCASLNTSSPPNGVYYITGNCTINRGGAAFNLIGSIVATGNITFGQINPLTITPTGSNPAIVAGGTLAATSISSANFTGLVYASMGISFVTFAFITRINNGALVSGADLTLTNVPTALITFDPNLNPPFFSGGGGGAVSFDSWKGHP